ncbi:hypothetical protein RB608_00055 [Nocardioides sp. LHD-245]|uniref:hypothetical protein n=1 Tax=Nocardioides sp. LHD-245 TaxID=3051387 RepID=UPI0027DED94C|nr:hypothetical protein [Nocardioides sp. LHD-245]
MPAVAEVVRAAADLPEEFAGPVGYADRWLWIGAALAAALVLYYLLAWWLTRPARPPAVERTDVLDVRRRQLARIDRIEERVRAGELPARDGHQQLSEVVRDYVAAVTPLPARTMALADLRDHAPAALVTVLELVYPPEFAPDEEVARDRFDLAVQQARGLVASWRVPGSAG